jgi:hypothetical protein
VGATNVLFGDLRPVGVVRVVRVEDTPLSMLALVPVELARWESSGLGVAGGDNMDIVVYH